MICKHCGREIGVEDLKCPHCGADNPFAQQHEQNMQQYGKRFDKTGRNVMDAAKGVGKLGVKAGVIVLLILGIIVTSLVYSYNYADHDDSDARKEKAAGNTEQNIAGIEELLDNGEYVECVSFMYAQGVMNSGADAYDDLRGVRYVAKNFYECIQLMEQMNLRSADEDFYDYLDSYIRNFCMYLNEFYETYDVWKDSTGGEKYQPYMVDMEQELRTAMRVYFSMDDAELEEFLSLSEAKKAVRLEEVFGHEE